MTEGFIFNKAAEKRKRCVTDLMPPMLLRIDPAVISIPRLDFESQRRIFREIQMAQEDGDVLGRVQYHGGSYEWDSNVSSALCWRIPYDDYGAYTDVIYPMMTLENQCDRFPHESILLPDVEWEGAGALKGRLKYLLVAEFICQLSDDADWEASTRFVDAIMQENMGKLYEVIRRIDDAAEAEYGGSKMVKYSNDYTEAGSSRVLERYNACMKAAKETGDS